MKSQEALYAFANRHWALPELVFTAALYTYTFQGVVRRSKQRLSGQLKRLPLIPFVLHVTIGTIEVFRYHVLALKGQPMADPFACVSGVVFAISSFQLSNTIAAGNTVLVRSCYQAMASMQLVGSIGAYAYGNAQLHRGVVRNYHQFLYLRFMIRRILNLKLIGNYHDAYALCVVIASCLSLSEGGYPYGIPIYFFLIGAFAALDHWVSGSIARTPNHSFLLNCLAKAGFCDVDTYRALHGQPPSGGYNADPENRVIPKKAG